MNQERRRTDSGVWNELDDIFISLNKQHDRWRLFHVISRLSTSPVSRRRGREERRVWERHHPQYLYTYSCLYSIFMASLQADAVCLFILTLNCSVLFIHFLFNELLTRFLTFLHLVTLSIFTVLSSCRPDTRSSRWRHCAVWFNTSDPEALVCMTAFVKKKHIGVS